MHAVSRRIAILVAALLVAGLVPPQPRGVAASGGGVGVGTPGPIVWARLIGDTQQLWTVMPGGEPVPVPGTVGARAARWSPDGRVLAFARWADGIFLVNPDGSGLRRLFTPAVGEVFGEPLWSPDGRRLAFGVLSPGGAEYHVEIADSLDGAREVVATELIYVTDWLPDGSFLGAARSPGERCPEELAVTHPDGSTHLITDTPAVCEGVPRLSPDGTRIAFLEARLDAAGFIDYAIAVVDTDGTDRRTLVDLGSEMTWPAWSPDGTEILYGYAPTAVRLDGTKRLVVAFGNGQDGLDWAALPDTVQAPSTPPSPIAILSFEPAGIRALALPDPSTKASATVSTATIWPYRDGYRDTVRIVQRMREPAGSRIDIYNSAGRAVRRFDLRYHTGTFDRAWNGRSASGRILPAGRYKIVVRAYDLAGNVKRTVLYVRLYRGTP
jgi:dipeptidyl aminopeptidase/acylaminoacyl peptidase